MWKFMDNRFSDQDNRSLVDQYTGWKVQVVTSFVVQKCPLFSGFHCHKSCNYPLPYSHWPFLSLPLNYLSLPLTDPFFPFPSTTSPFLSCPLISFDATYFFLDVFEEVLLAILDDIHQLPKCFLDLGLGGACWGTQLMYDSRKGPLWACQLVNDITTILVQLLRLCSPTSHHLLNWFELMCPWDPIRTLLAFLARKLIQVYRKHGCSVATVYSADDMSWWGVVNWKTSMPTNWCERTIMFLSVTLTTKEKLGAWGAIETDYCSCYVVTSFALGLYSCLVFNWFHLVFDNLHDSIVRGEASHIRTLKIVPFATDRTLHSLRRHNLHEAFRAEGVTTPKAPWIMVKILTVLFDTYTAL